MSLLIICGLHRSGTTYVGEVIKKAGVSVVHEPLNQYYGMKGISIAYPYVKSSDGDWASLVDDAVNMSRSWSRNDSLIQGGFLKRGFYRLTGGRTGLRWGALRIRKYIGMLPSTVCIKDPFMSLATPYLVEHFGLKTLCLVRHPAAIYYSTRKQGWRFDIENLLVQPELIKHYSYGIPDAHWDLARKHSAASIALLWKIMMRVNEPLAHADDRVMIITHESLCIEPLKMVGKIMEHFNLEFTSGLQRFVIDNSEGKSAEGRTGQTHDFQRDSRAIPDVWRSKLDASDQKMIFDIAGDEIYKIYGRM